MKDASRPYLDWLDHGADPPDKVSAVGWVRAGDILINRLRSARADIIAGAGMPALAMYMRTCYQIGALITWVQTFGPRTAYLNQERLKSEIKRLEDRRDAIESTWPRARGRHILDGLLRRRGPRKLTAAERALVEELRGNCEAVSPIKQRKVDRRSQRELAKHYKREEMYQDECLKNGVFLTRRQAMELPKVLRMQARSAARKHGHPNSWFITADGSVGASALSHLSDRTLRETLWRQSQAYKETNASVSAVLRLRHEEAVNRGSTDYASYQIQDQAISSVRTVKSILTTYLEKSMPAQRIMERNLQKAAARLGYDQIQPWDRGFIAQQSHTVKIEEPARAFSLDCAINVIIPELAELGGWKVENIRQVDTSFRSRWCFDMVHQPSVEYIESLRASDPEADLPSPRRVQLWFVPFSCTRHEELGLDAYSQLVRQRWNSVGSDNPACQYTDDVASTQEEGVPALMRSVHVVAMQLNEGDKWLNWVNLSCLIHEMGHALHDMATLPIHHGHGNSFPVDMSEFPSQLLESIANDPRLLVKWAKASPGSEKRARNVSYWTRWLQKEALWVGYIRNQALDGLIDLHLHGMKPQPGEVIDVQKIYQQMCRKYLIDCHDDDRTVFRSFIWEGYVSCYYSYIFGQILTRAIVNRRKDMTINSELVKKKYRQLLENVLATSVDGPSFAKAWKKWRGEALKDSLYRGARLYGKDMSQYVRALQGELPK